MYTSWRIEEKNLNEMDQKINIPFQQKDSNFQKETRVRNKRDWTTTVDGEMTQYEGAANEHESEMHKRYSEH